MKKHHEKEQAAAEPAPPAPESGEAAAKEPGALQEQLLRLRADFENYRKRAARERQELSDRAAEDLLVDILPVLDHFELGLKTAAEHGADASVIEGFQLVYDQLQAALRKAGLQPVAADAGEPFDPHRHEAVSHVASDVVASDAILQATRRGYTLGGRLLRAAQVVVSRGPAAEEDPAGSGDGEGQDG